MTSEAGAPESPPIVSRAAWTRLLLGFALIYLLFEALARDLGSDRGQFGPVVAVAVVAGVLAAELVLFGQPLTIAWRSVGLKRPDAAGLVVGAGIGALLALTIPLSFRVLGVQATFTADAAWVLPGVFAQAGIAEELLFRGYLFGHLRSGRSFWRAAGLSIVPFAAVHLGLFATLSAPLAAAALVLAVSSSLPLAHLFELGGRSIWAPAIVHFVVQAVPKIVALPPGDASRFTLAWIAACATVPWLALLSARRL
jgi:membrane protease YdiL (CAAX protease family)